MSGEAYELLAMLMRYIFVLMGALILLRAFRWLRRDAHAYKREMRALPDAGLVGEIVDLRSGENQPLPREGMIGSARECDIRLKGAGIARRHAMFSFEEGKGLRVTPHRGNVVLMEGVDLRGPAFALHGTQLQLGEATLRVRLFAGLPVPHPARMQELFAEADWPSDGMVQRPEDEGFDGPDTVPPPFAPVNYAEDALDDLPPDDSERPQPYAGNYTDDGQMTWQYAAYPLEELYRAQQEQAQGQEAPTDLEEDEAMPYQSPVPRRRRRARK